MIPSISALLATLALPTVGLPAVFVISLVSATLLPMGSEPAVFAVIAVNPDLFWPAILVATTGNTIGGAISYGMGVGAKKIFMRERDSHGFRWLQRFGPKTLLLAWLPVIGDPLCSIAGWLKMPFWPSVGYMAVGKLLRYLSITLLLQTVPDGFWHRFIAWF
ncbi:MAG: YqaA family protein [Burkholderiaceae bacterium]